MRYSANHRTNIKAVDGLTFVGSTSPEGYQNVIVATVGQGLYHPSGCWRVTVNNEDIYRGIYAPDGSLYVTTVDYNNGALKVFEASGTITESGAEGFLEGESEGISIDFLDSYFIPTTGKYGSMIVVY